MRNMCGSNPSADFTAVPFYSIDQGKLICDIAMRSTTSSGASKIVAHFKSHGPVTIPRSLVHIVVTEWGVADLQN